MKLGKKKPKHDARTALLYNFINHATLPDPAPVADWASRLPDDVGMMANDRIGLCTVAGIAHLLQLWTSNAGTLVTISDDDVIATYKAITLKINGVAYDEAAPLDTSGENPTDTGLCLLDVLNYVRANGIGGHGKGLAFVKVNHLDIQEMRIATQLFGGTYVGVALPATSLEHVGTLWGDATGPTAGGHCIATHKVDPMGPSYITWGKRQPATWAWHLWCCDEAYAIIAPEWVSDDVLAPSGFCIEKLRTYLAAL